MKAQRKLAAQLIGCDASDLEIYLRDVTRIKSSIVATLVGVLLCLWRGVALEWKFGADQWFWGIVTGTIVCAAIVLILYLTLLACDDGTHEDVRNYLEWENKFRRFFSSGILQHDCRMSAQGNIREEFVAMAGKIVAMKTPPLGSLEMLSEAYKVASARFPLESFEALCNQAHREFEEGYFT